MRIQHILTVFAVALAAFAPAVRAEKPGTPPAKIEAASPETAKPKAVTREDYARRKAAVEKAETAPEVIAAAKADAESETALAKAAKDLKAAKAENSPDLKAKQSAFAAARKAHAEAHANVISVRRAVIAKTDPESAKIDERIFENSKRMAAAKEAKAAKGDKDDGDDDHDHDHRDAKSKGKGLEKAPGQLKKEKGGDATDFAPGQEKKRGKGKKDKGGDAE